MADDLIAEEIERDAVIVAPRQLAAQLRHVEVEGRVEVGAGDRKVERIVAVAHRCAFSLLVSRVSVEEQQRVGAQAQPQRFQRDGVGEGHIGEVHVGAEPLDEGGLQRLVRRLEDQVCTSMPDSMISSISP